MASRLRDTAIDELDAARAFAATLQRNLRFVREDEKPEVAALLRRKGWSYRRIAEALSTPYGVVSRWLSGPDSEPRHSDAGGRSRAARRAAQAAPQAASEKADDAATAAVASRIDELAERLDQVVEGLERERQTSRGREERLLTAIDELKAAIAALKG